jgi:hypothetical protein
VAEIGADYNRQRPKSNAALTAKYGRKATDLAGGATPR